MTAGGIAEGLNHAIRLFHRGWFAVVRQEVAWPPGTKRERLVRQPIERARAEPFEVAGEMLARRFVDQCTTGNPTTGTAEPRGRRTLSNRCASPERSAAR